MIRSYYHCCCINESVILSLCSSALCSLGHQFHALLKVCSDRDDSVPLIMHLPNWLVTSCLSKQQPFYDQSCYVQVMLNAHCAFNMCINCTSPLPRSFLTCPSFYMCYTPPPPSHCSPIVWTLFFQRCPHWFCTQN